MATFKTPAEKYFERVRRLMLKAGYDRSHAALQSLSRLRKSMRAHGYDFQTVEGVAEVNNG